MQLPFGILGVSIATVTFPLLSRHANAKREKDFSETLGKALAVGLFLMVPCTVGIWIVAEPACRLAFEYGKFTAEATQAAAEATALYALGLVGYTGVKVLLPAYYAHRQRPQAPLRFRRGHVDQRGIKSWRLSFLSAIRICVFGDWPWHRVWGRWSI